MAESSKRKTWKNIISTLSEEESFSPLELRNRAADSDEGTKQVLEDFLEDKLGIAIAENLDFQRVHPTGKFSNSKGNQGR